MMVSILLFSLFSVLVMYQLRFSMRRRAPARALPEILSKLERVNKDGLQLIADGYLYPNAEELRLEPPMMWELVGGSEGVKRLSLNATLMLELAVVAEQWNRVDGIIMAETLRRDALRIRKAVRQVRLGMLWNGASASVAFHLQEAVSSYCLMRGRLLDFYQDAHVALVPQLEAAM